MALSEVVCGPSHLGICPECGSAIVEIQREISPPTKRIYLGGEFPLTATVTCCTGHTFADVEIRYDVNAPAPPFPHRQGGNTMKTRLILTILAAMLIAAAPAAARTRHHAHHRLRCHAGYVKRTIRVRERRHGRLVHVRRARCVHVTAKPAPKPASPAPVSNPSPAPAPAPAPTVRAGIDPTYTQDRSDNLHVTWNYSASSTGNLPAGVLSLAVQQPSNGANVGGCTMNVGGVTTGGTCTVELPAYGNYQVTVTYADSDPTVAPAASTDTETIEPLPATINRSWGTDQPTANPSITATVIGSTANTTVTDQGGFEGASTVTLTDNLGDGCQATVNGTQASCQMPVTGTPASYSIAYPGGTSTQSTQPVAPNGTQQVTTNWPAETVPVSNPAVTVQQATVEECGGGVQGNPSPWPVATGCSYGNPNQWPNPLGMGTGHWVVFFAITYGSLASDRDPSHGGGYVSGYLTFNVTGGTEGVDYTEANYQAGPDNSADCSVVTTQQWLGGSQTNYGPDEPMGGCWLKFTTPGTYTVTVTYTSEDPNYATVRNVDSETINVT